MLRGPDGCGVGRAHRATEREERLQRSSHNLDETDSVTADLESVRGRELVDGAEKFFGF